MRLTHGRYLVYGSGAPTEAGWQERVQTVRDHVCQAGEELGLGLRLDENGTRELLSPGLFAEFRRWLATERCYICTVDAPPAAWTGPESLNHVCRLLDGLGELLPEGVDGSVGVFLTEAHRAEVQLQAIYANLIHTAVRAAEVTGRTGRRVRLALATETPRFLEPLVDAFPDQFGACFDVDSIGQPGEALAALERAKIPVLKLRLGHVSRVTSVLDWLEANVSEGQYLETSSAQDFRRTLHLLAERGLALNP